MSFQFEIGAKRRKVARFLASAHRELVEAFLDERSSRKITQQEIASKIGVHRSVINRQLTGAGNLTLRTLAEWAYALDRDVEIRISKRGDHKANWKTPVTHSNLEPKRLTVNTGRYSQVSSRSGKHPEYSL